jgi:hypothetical protein
MEIKPIETQYKGYRFRSRLEARWAVFFDALDQKWEYEKEGYTLDGGIKYLPDFWLPLHPGVDIGHFLEIKPIEPNEVEREKLLLLSIAIGKPVICFWGLPGDSDEWHMTLYRNNECRLKDGVFRINYYHQQVLKFMDDHMKRIYYLPFDYAWHIQAEFNKIDSLQKAFTSFRSARFEFGERG